MNIFVRFLCVFLVENFWVVVDEQYEIIFWWVLVCVNFYWDDGKEI